MDQGTLTQDQANEIADQQLEAKLKREFEQTLEEKLTVQRQVDTVATELNKYRDAYPDLMNAGSENRRRVTFEYEQLIAMGQPATPATEVLACRLAFGPANRLRETTRETKETHSETGGAATASEPKGDGAPKSLNAKLKAHYAKQIERGAYKGWDDPVLKKELTYVRS